MFRPDSPPRRTVTQLARIIVAMLAGPAAAFAHQGPPFPILVDQPAAGYLVSVWADPDIGDAQFFIIVETPDGDPPAEAPHVSTWAEPVSGRLQRVRYETTQQTLRNQVQFEANPYFDQRDTWTVGFRLTAPGGQSGELTTEIESTPPGYGQWDLAIYLFPFLLLAVLWIAAVVRRRRATTKDEQSADAKQGATEQACRE